MVLIPVVMAGIFYLHSQVAPYQLTGTRRMMMLALTFLLLYGWIGVEVWVRKQQSIFQMATQSTFFVYVFTVLTLTGIFILFREVSVHDWWNRVNIRVHRKDRVNVELFRIFSIYRLTNTQILGNFFMLMPLGIYLPLLYKRVSHLVAVAVVAFLVSACIECLQLITSYRSADVDDILLNTAGAVVGFIIFKILFFISKSVILSAKSTAVA